MKKRFRDNEKVFLLKPRNILISKALIGRRIGIHNGLWSAVKDMVSALLGYRLGEMSAPRKTGADLHVKKKKKKKKKK
jgi:ribosomal protein S19